MELFQLIGICVNKCVSPPSAPQLGSAHPVIEDVIIGGHRHHHGHRDLVIDIERDSERDIILEPRHRHHHHHGRRGEEELLIEEVDIEAPRRLPCHKHHRDIVVEEVRDVEIESPRREIVEDVVIERKRSGDCNKKPDVFVHKLSPIVVHGKPRHIVVEAGKAQVIRTPPVFIHRKGQVHYESPRVVHHQQKPIFLTEKILKVQRPIHKKVFVEKFVREESAGHEEVVEKKLCQSSAREIERSSGFVERLDLGERIASGDARIENVEVEVDRNGSVELDVELDVKLPRRVEIERERELVL